ncbi:MAG: protein phosphatase 2C domain-containing protein [Lachnospiraceae bacterium]|jgi:protein phosphatase|nr:protein phosphatase 2C domain-containing protein [Lachnospiraceae bacterium]
MECIEIVGISNVGKVRTNNQDNLYCNGVIKDLEDNTFIYKTKVDKSERVICAIADGMGGLRYGEEAAYYAVCTLKKYIEKKNEAGQIPSVRSAIKHMNKSVCKLAKKKNAIMGSTVTVLKYVDNKIAMYNLGDSKGFLYRDGRLFQMTTDHTENASMKRMNDMIGGFDEGKAKNTLTQHLGIEEDEFIVEPGVSEVVAVQKGDIVMLTSDGLTGMVEKDVMIGILQNYQIPLEEKAKILIDKAVEAGGKDNISIILVEM